jgi:hypothetical protein
MWKDCVTLAIAVLSWAAALSAGGLQTVTLDTRDPYFERKSALKVGAKGEDTIDVSAAGACAFHHAELVWLDRRFADAQFVQIPEQACTRCDPLIVRWYHEPTGKLHFQVRVYRTRCAARPER